MSRPRKMFIASLHSDRGPDPAAVQDEAWKQCREYRILLKEWIVQQDMIAARDADFLRSMYRPRLSRDEERARKRQYLANWHAKKAAAGGLAARRSPGRPKVRPESRKERMIA